MRRTGVLLASVVLLVTACSGSSGPANAGSAATATTHVVRVVNQNLLHGNACPADSNRCDLPGRVQLFLNQLIGQNHSCPEIVAIEEANPQTVAELRKHLPGSCGYYLVYDDDPGQDREVVLSTFLVLGSERRRLAGPLRTALWVRVASNDGPVDLVATHLASSSDDRPCDASTCPPPCKVSDTLNACQGREAVAFLREKRGPHSVAVLAGDLNAHPNEPTITAIKAAGLVDTHLAMHNAECSPKTGRNCTSGRIDDSLVDLTNAHSKQTERIDYVFLDPTPRCTLGRPTGLFAAAGVGAGERSSLVFPADHNGVIATIRCRTTSKDLAASKAIRSTTTTTPPGIALTPAVKDAVTAAFTTLFAPNPDPNAQLATLENAAALRDSFIARKQQVGDLANRTSVRIDSFAGSTANIVDVTFSIMIDGNVVLDALPGRAKLVGGHWLVTTTTYCQVATLGIDTIPEACKK
jgi:Endonuclease/Exonuclease/phosphatase family.